MLTLKDGRDIRALYAEKHTLQAIADRYNVSESYISLIVSNQRLVDNSLPKTSPANRFPRWTHEGVTYIWRLYAPIMFLYGKVVRRSSLTPDGMTLTLRTIDDEELVIRGEQHGKAIAFYHIEGQGGGFVIGQWVPVKDER